MEFFRTCSLLLLTLASGARFTTRDWYAPNAGDVGSTSVSADDSSRYAPNDGDVDSTIVSMVRGAASAFVEQHRSVTESSTPSPRTLQLYDELQQLTTERHRLQFMKTLTHREQRDLQAYSKERMEDAQKSINGGRPLSQATPGDNSRPEVAFDEAWFSRNCDLKSDPTANTAYYRNQGWQEYKKCEDREGVAIETAEASKEDCEKQCMKVADADPSSTYCCEFDSTGDGKCSVSKSFSSMKGSSKGKFANIFTESGMKHAKYVKSKKRTVVEDNVGDEFGGIQESSDFMKRLVEQVNHMSIDGILKHLLSFYTCMRWVPDEQFIKLTKFEMQNVDVDATTRRSDEEVTDDDAIAAYVNFDAVPLKCSSGMDVQDLGMIDTLLEELKNEDSDINEAYKFSESVAEQTFNFIGTQKWFGATDDTKKRMGNTVEVDEMNSKAHTVLPWDGFIRPSQQYTWGVGWKWGTHISKPKNQFLICFGPRVSSFPHKREGGGHFLADMNMAGCNGLWDLKDAIHHIQRIRQLFAPETCLTDDLKRKLKTTFLETFVEMNAGFEKKITGNMFSGGYQGVNTIPDELRDTTSAYLESMDPNQPDFLQAGVAEKKYRRMGRLVSGAHTKWVVCGANHPDTPAVGLASSFFNSPSAYRKWFDAAANNEKMIPECKTYDPFTGCMKCVIAVRSHPHRCLLRLGLTFDQIMDAVGQKVAPMASTFDSVRTVDQLNDEGQVIGQKKVLKQESGVCMVQKDSRDRSRKTDRELFRTVGLTDRVVRVSRSKVSDMGFSMKDRYGLPDRRKALAEVVAAGTTKHDEKTEQERLEEAITRLLTEGEQTHAPEERFGPRMTFSEVIPEENNVVAHEVDYLVTCPCQEDDFSAMESNQALGISSMADYMTG